jgi:hypothetical protein
MSTMQAVRLTAPARSDVTESQLQRAIAAAEFAHKLICPKRIEHEAAGCMSARELRSSLTIAALEHLDRSPKDAATLRIAYHDAACMSGCTGASAEDHAKRTQSKVATALRKFHASEMAA